MLRRAILGVLAACLVAVPARAQDATLDEVLSNYYEAIGGLEAWESVQSMKASGTMQMGPGMEAPFRITAKRPRNVRIEFDVQGTTGIQAYDGETAWMLLPFMGQTEAQPMPPEQAKSIKEEADLDGPLVGYEEDGHQVELLGTEQVEGTEAYKLKLTLKNGDVRYVYLDSEYYLPIKAESVRQIQGREVEFVTSLGDYKEVNGLMMAHSIESKPKGTENAQVITIESVEFGVDVKDGQFTMPEPEKKEGAETEKEGGGTR